MDFTRQRNDDLMCAYREQLALAKYIVMPEIFEKVAESPARRFWVSEERAAVEVARMLVGKPFSRMRHNKREMFEEIFRRYIYLMVRIPTVLPDLANCNMTICTLGRLDCNDCFW